MESLSTRQVAVALGVTVDALSRAVWAGKFPAPEKNQAGNYLWTPDAIQHAANYFSNIERHAKFPAPIFPSGQALCGR
ncbi:MAG TPA: hypothetical protein PKB02_10650 [Anaerohalosphaeraceae bacterium]|nr:hypothetical protein [Anaerohalosphaeraceae bacterium]